MTSALGLSWERPTERARQWIEIELDHPVNPWEHDGAGSITWGAQLDRMTPLGEEAVSIIKEAWQHREEKMRDQTRRQRDESEPVGRVAIAGTSIKPGWAGRIELDQYWVNLTLYQPVNERWKRELEKNWSHQELIDDGILKRGVIVEATTDLGRRALRIVEALHSAHPYNELDAPENWREWTESRPRSALRWVAPAMRSIRIRALRSSRLRPDRDSR
ncbi:MAG: hypothetical protein ACXVII_44705 [Solirubrobacteraceae bacterium]